MKRSSILFIITSVLALGVVIAWFYINQPVEKVENVQGIKVSATSLANAYTEDEKAANTQYISKALEVTGIVAEVSKNQDGKTVVLLESNDPMSGVQCTMRDAKKTPVVGEQVSIKGFCNGYTMVVLLSDCVFI